MRITEGDGDPRHGTHNGYTNLACRCRRCKAATSAYRRGRAYLELVCPFCGPYDPPTGRASHICPRCEMTPGEHAYRARILADSDAVYRAEVRAYNAARAAERAA